MHSGEPIPVPREYIECLILAAAPERRNDLEEIWRVYAPEFYCLSDRKGITCHTRGNKIEWDNKTLGFVWICGFTAWEILRCHSPHVIVSLASGQPLGPGLLESDLGFRDAEAGFDQLLYTLKTIKDVSDLDAIWPESVPNQQADKTGFGIEQQAVFDVIMIATAFILLHEIQHVIFNHAGNHPNSAVDEETKCDTFACGFLLDDLADYASEKCFPSEKVLMKRAMGLALAAFVIFEMTPADQLGGNKEYPPAADRLEMLIKQRRAEVDNDYWLFAASILVALLRRHNRTMELPVVDPREMCGDLIDELRRHTATLNQC